MFKRLVRFFRRLFKGSARLERKITTPGKVIVQEPEWSMLAKKELGVKEFAGKARSNPIVEGYFRDSGHNYKDHIAWCAAFVGACLVRAGCKGTGKLNARSYLNWGITLDEPKLGCICVIWRGSPDSWEGHVFFYAGREGKYILGLGGNQSDEVNVEKYPEARILGYRWPNPASPTQ